EAGGWRFRSASVREVAYHTITKADRARRHAGVARAMAAGEGPKGVRPDIIAHHWATAAELTAELGGAVRGVPRDLVKRAVDALLASARNDVDRLYPRPAVEQVSRALALGADSIDDATRRALVLARAGAWVELRQFADAESDLVALRGEAEAAEDW